MGSAKCNKLRIIFLILFFPAVILAQGAERTRQRYSGGSVSWDVVVQDTLDKTGWDKYNSRLKALDSISPVISIILKDYIYKDGFLTIYAKVKNNSDLPIYLIRNIECVLPANLIIKDSKGEEVKRNLVRIDCVGEKIMADTTDLILIPAGDTLDYPPVKAEFYDFREMRMGRYYISLEYKYKKDWRFSEKNIPDKLKRGYVKYYKAMQRALEGKYVSTNELMFFNKH